ncbi:MAG: hypothetical protein GVY13_19730 [Alphaproteobacteria bacterium]|jgi:phage major head subunit gpT-like protein|nr:hypothetical protein [Alphaproteobacteria bacterium]
MIVNQATLTTLFVGFKTTFQAAFRDVEPTYRRVATVVPSSTREETYGWLKDFPRIREWVGDRVITSISQEGYRIRNKDWEFTVAVDRNDIEDDNFSIYAPMVAEIGRAAASFPDELVWPLLKDGFAATGYDGKPFFAADHPVLDAGGTPQAVSNTGGGSGTGWYLLDTSRTIKPLIFQNRKEFQFTRMDAASDELVFNRKEYRYGIDGRANVGFGFWQLAYGSKDTLDATTYAAARAAMQGMTGDFGRPLGVRPDLLVVPPALEAAAREIVMAERTDAGATNVWRGSAELLVVPWLA